MIICWRMYIGLPGLFVFDLLFRESKLISPLSYFFFRRPKVPGTTGRVPPRKRIEENTGGKTKRKNKIVVTAESEG